MNKSSERLWNRVAASYDSFALLFHSVAALNTHLYPHTQSFNIIFVWRNAFAVCSSRRNEKVATIKLDYISEWNDLVAMLKMKRHI